MSDLTATFTTTPDAAPPDAPGGGDPFPGQFALVRRLGGGAFGEAWLARDLSPLGRLVALKFLSGAAPGPLAALKNEAALLASLDHPHIVRVHAWLDGPAGPCLVLAFVAGGSLADRVERDGPLPWQLAARYVADVADGLVEVHRRGIVHRDVKPANVLWDRDADEAVLTDFGIAARLSDQGSEAGTPLFMAPEAFDGELSPALDVYGLAASLFWLVTGGAPFAGSDTRTLLRSIRTGLPDPDPRCAGLPGPLERLLRAALEPRPTARPTAADFAALLRGALNHLLADSLAVHAPARPVDVRLMVSKFDGGAFVPVAASHATPERAVRDLRRVPRSPERVVLHTGEQVRLEVQVDRPGYLTLFNIGPTGNLNLLWPESTSAPQRALDPGKPFHVLDVELTPPIGTERLFALWTSDPLPVRLEELRSLVDAGAHRATRDLVRVQKSIQQLPADTSQVVVLELDHTSAQAKPSSPEHHR